MISHSILLPFPLSSMGQLDSKLAMFQVLGAYQPEKNRLWGLVPGREAGTPEPYVGMR